MQCGVYFHPSKQQSLAVDAGGKTPLSGCGSALHQLENRYIVSGSGRSFQEMLRVFRQV